MRELRLWAAAAAAPAAAAGFSLLAGLRRRRSLHPTGTGYHAWFRVDDGRPAVPLFRSGAAQPAMLRFSRAAGLPEPLPDALGVAIKLPNAHGPSADQDLLVTSSIDRPLLRRLLFPATSFVRGAFSSALPYQLGDQRVVLLLIPVLRDGGRPSTGVVRRRGGALAELEAAIAAGLQFQLRTAGSFGPSQPLATLTTGPPLSTEQTEQLRFNPWTTGPGIRPSGWLNLLRDTAYRASQRGRPQPSAGQLDSVGRTAVCAVDGPVRVKRRMRWGRWRRDQDSDRLARGLTRSPGPPQDFIHPPSIGANQPEPPPE